LKSPRDVPPGRFTRLEGVVAQVPVDGVRDLTFQAAACFGRALPGGEFAFEVVASRPGMGALGDGDHVDGVVQLPVPAAVEAVPDVRATRRFAIR
jgi:hypothetical protein